MMTTKFDSFDESPAGAFVESPAGARNVVVAPQVPDTLIGLVVYVTEIQYTYSIQIDNIGLNAWDDDLAAYGVRRTVIRDRGFPVSAVLIQHKSVSGEYEQIVPDGRTKPNSVTLVKRSTREESFDLLKQTIVRYAPDGFNALYIVRDGNFPNVDPQLGLSILVAINEVVAFYREQGFVVWSSGFTDRFLRLMGIAFQAFANPVG